MKRLRQGLVDSPWEEKHFSGAGGRLWPLCWLRVEASAQFVVERNCSFFSENGAKGEQEPGWRSAPAGWALELLRELSQCWKGCFARASLALGGPRCCLLVVSVSLSCSIAESHVSAFRVAVQGGFQGTDLPSAARTGHGTAVVWISPGYPAPNSAPSSNSGDEKCISQSLELLLIISVTI